MLACPVALECFQPEAGQFQIPERGGRVQEIQSNPSRLFDALRFPAEPPIQQELQIFLAARADHTIAILRYPYNEGSHDCRERTEKIAGGDAGSYLTGGKARRIPHPTPAQSNADPGNIRQCRNKRGSHPGSCGYVDFVAWAERCLDRGGGWRFWRAPIGQCVDGKCTQGKQASIEEMSSAEADNTLSDTGECSSTGEFGERWFPRRLCDRVTVLGDGER